MDERFGRTRTGKTDLKALFDIEVMNFPKPVRLMAHLLDISVDDGDIVLDFFAGSCPLGQAMFESASKSNALARFILVQFPEPVLDRSQNGRNAISIGCKTVADIGKERLRRAGKKIKKGNPESAADLGFRVFKLDSSNIKAWEPNPDDLEQSLLDHVDHIRGGRTEQDILYELLLKRGLDLCAPIEARYIAGRQVNAVDGGALIACLVEEITPAEVEELALGIAAWRDELDNTDDTTMVFRDSAFSDDVAKTNCTEILRQRGIRNVRSI